MNHLPPTEPDSEKQHPELPTPDHDSNQELGIFSDTEINLQMSPLQDKDEIPFIPMPIKPAVGQQFTVELAKQEFQIRLVENGENHDVQITLPTGEKQTFSNVITPDSPQCTIGRHPICELCLPENPEYQTISRKHLVIHFHYPSGKILLSDPGSSNHCQYQGRTHSPEDKKYSKLSEIGTEVQSKEFEISEEPERHVFLCAGVIIEICTSGPEESSELCPIEVRLRSTRHHNSKNFHVTGKSQYTIGYQPFDDFSLAGAPFRQNQLTLSIITGDLLIVTNNFPQEELYFIRTESRSHVNPDHNDTAKVIRPNFGQ